MHREYGESVPGTRNREVMRREDPLEIYRRGVERSIAEVGARIAKEKRERDYIPYKSYVLNKLHKEIVSGAKKSLDVEISETDLELTTPPPNISGDFSITTYNLAKQLRKNPKELAKEIAVAINLSPPDLIDNVEVIGAYINLESRKDKLYSAVLRQIWEFGERYGESDLNKRKIALFDYSSPNVAKPIGVGHLRSTIIGQALINIYHETGYSVIRDNHLGDWGTQFGKLVYAYRTWGDERKLARNPIHELKDLYIRFHEEAKERPEIEDEARELFRKLEERDPEVAALWKRFRDLSIEEFEKTYRRLGIEFDLQIGESYFFDKCEELIQDCLNKGLCERGEEGGVVVVKSLNGLPTFLLRKQDGTTLYATRDLVTLRERVRAFKPEVILYVVGDEQNLYFQQIFAVAKRLGYLPETKAEHIGFGMVLRDGKKMSTRRGTLIELEELMSESKKRAREILLQKNQDLTAKEIEEISEAVGIGAIIYNDLRQDRGKNISFEWERMLDFQSGSAVYLQYTCVRIKSIMKKTSELFGNDVKITLEDTQNIVFENELEFELAKKLMFFPSVITNAQRGNAPHLIRVYLEDLADTFNMFYMKVSVIRTKEQGLLKSRVLLVDSVEKTIRRGLGLLNIQVPSKI